MKISVMQKTKEEKLDLTIYTKSGKLRKRKQKKSLDYFNKETEDAIVEYLKSVNQIERNKLYNKYIDKSFNKLAENIIHTFKFYYTDLDNIEDLKHEVVTFLIEKLHRYDQNLGKAYSFFGTIAKRYLIVYNINNYKKLKSKADLEDVDEEKIVWNNEYYGDDSKISFASSLSESDEKLYYFIESFIRHIQKNIDKYFPDVKDQDIVFAILEIFKRRESLEIYNKQHFYLFIREITGQPTPYITKIVKALKTIYKQQMNVMYLNGELDSDENILVGKINKKA